MPMSTDQRLAELEALRAALDDGQRGYADQLLRHLLDETSEELRRERADEPSADDLFAGLEPGGCPQCRPFACDDPDNHLGVDPKYTPLKNRGCMCGADFDGRDCMCFEGLY